jgi:tight adherence protein B
MTETIILRAALFVVITVVVVCALELASSESTKNLVGEKLRVLDERYEKRLSKKQLEIIYNGSYENKKYIEKVDDIIESSSIRFIFPLITSEIFLFSSIVIAVVSTTAFHAFIYSSVIFDILIFISGLFLPYLLLKKATAIVGGKIDSQILPWLNTLSNLSATNDDIVAIVEKSTLYLKTPLRKYAEGFVLEAKQGVELQNAITHFEDKVSNRRLKQFIRNLGVCSKHDADYKKVINKSKILLRGYFIEKARRKKDITQGKMDIVVTLVIGIVLFYIVVALQPEFSKTITETFIGNLLIGYNLFVLLFGIYKMITIDELNF